MKTIHPLMIDECLVGMDVILFSKGHHEAAAFVAACEEQYSAEIDPADVGTGYWRAVPDSRGEYDMRYLFEVKPGQGAFPVTFERRGAA